MYLTGATLFLSLVLSRVFYILLDFIHTQEELIVLQGKTAKGSSVAGESEELRKRVRELEAQLKTSQSQDRDFGEIKPPTAADRRHTQEAGVATGHRVQPSG